MTDSRHVSFGHPARARAGFRWFGPESDVPILMLAQIPGVTDIVTALHHVPNGEAWTVAEILQRKIAVEFREAPHVPPGLIGAARDDFFSEAYRNLLLRGARTGLVWSTIESLPFTEAIKNGGPERDAHIENFKSSLANLGSVNRMLREKELAAAGADSFRFLSVMGNFMLVADWTRTGYALLPDGSKALEYNHLHFSAFDIFMARRHQLPNGTPDLDAYVNDGSYDRGEVEAAESYWRSTLGTDAERQEDLATMIVAGLPGAQASFGRDASLEIKLKIFREAVLKYKGMTVEDLRRNIDYFLTRIVASAEEAGLLLCCHPDDPSYSPFLGTPRAVGDVSGYKFLLDRGCGVGLCFGSMTAAEKNRDVMGVVEELAEYGLARGLSISQIFPFVHLRPIETRGKDFREGLHASHIEELNKIVLALVSYGWTGVFRPDHAPDPLVLHELVTGATGNEKALGNRGYSVPGRAMAANLLLGLFYGAYQLIVAQEGFTEDLVTKGFLKSSERNDALKTIRRAAFEKARKQQSHLILPPALADTRRLA